MHSFHFLLVRARCATDGASESVSTCVRFAHSQPKRGLALIYVDRGAAERMEKTSWSRTWGIRPAIRDLGLIICSVFCLVWVPCTHVCIVPMFLVSELLFMSGVCVRVCVCVCVVCTLQKDGSNPGMWCYKVSYVYPTPAILLSTSLTNPHSLWWCGPGHYH